ncbi:serotransferrin-1-like [Pseudochaenichthys georgianus]|uniref:serotransferrin-1-like n=1 Tax=Pseudochaenichthys georgianus TaxID=52239 RepID=UPI00146C79DC|nr:serotransferrin-1-like [Pseudochaenichthys georgianus]
MGLIYSQTQDCDFTKFFSSGCAPGSELSSSFCSQCVGSRRAAGDESKCKASAEEQYYGYAGAFRCLVEDAGDVAFIKHTIVPENSNGKGPEWAKGLNANDYQLICPGQPAGVEISEYATCNLAAVPANAVVTRPETHDKVVKILHEQQAKFGSSGSDGPFRMFHSDLGNNLLFKDSTKCLQTIPKGTSYDTFLGEEYMTAIKVLRQCSESTPELEKSCTFHPCQQNI